MQKKVADRMRELMGTETVMLNDPMFMKTLCQRLEEKHRVRHQSIFVVLLSTINPILERYGKALSTIGISCASV